MEFKSTIEEGKQIDIKRVIEQSSESMTVDDLAKKGFSKIKVLDEDALSQLIAEAVKKVALLNVERLNEQEKKKLYEQARQELQKLMDERSAILKRQESLDNEKNLLREETDKLRDQQEELLRQSSEYKQETLRLKNKIIELEDEITKLQNTRADTDDREKEIGYLNTKIKFYEEEKTQYERAIEANKAYIQDIESKLYDLKNTNEQLESKVSLSSKEIDDLRAEILKLASEPKLNPQQEEELIAKTKKVASLEKQIVKFKNQIKTAKEKSYKLSGANYEQSKEISNLKLQISKEELKNKELLAKLEDKLRDDFVKKTLRQITSKYGEVLEKKVVRILSNNLETVSDNSDKLLKKVESLSLTSVPYKEYFKAAIARKTKVILEDCKEQKLVNLVEILTEFSGVVKTLTCSNEDIKQFTAIKTKLLQHQKNWQPELMTSKVTEIPEKDWPMSFKAYRLTEDVLDVVIIFNKLDTAVNNPGLIKEIFKSQAGLIVNVTKAAKTLVALPKAKAKRKPKSKAKPKNTNKTKSPKANKAVTKQKVKVVRVVKTQKAKTVRKTAPKTKTVKTVKTVISPVKVIAPQKTVILPAQTAAVVTPAVAPVEALVTKTTTTTTETTTKK